MSKDIHQLIMMLNRVEMDDTIRTILIRDLNQYGLSDYLKKQILAMCQEGIKRAKKQIASQPQVV